MSGPNVAIIDYGAGNLRSVAKALESLGANTMVTDDLKEMEASDALILPGQGACDSAMIFPLTLTIISLRAISSFGGRG